MTKVGRAFEEEKQEAVREAEKEEAKRIAKSLLDVLSLELIAEKTGLDIEEVEKLKEQKITFIEEQSNLIWLLFLIAIRTDDDT